MSLSIFLPPDAIRMLRFMVVVHTAHFFNYFYDDHVIFQLLSFLLSEHQKLKDNVIRQLI